MRHFGARLGLGSPTARYVGRRQASFAARDIGGDEAEDLGGGDDQNPEYQMTHPLSPGLAPGRLDRRDYPSGWR